jgi:hypothetical protein
MASLLGAQWIMASRLPPAHVDNARAPSSSTGTQQTPPPNPGRPRGNGLG